MSELDVIVSQSIPTGFNGNLGTPETRARILQRADQRAKANSKYFAVAFSLSVLLALSTIASAFLQLAGWTSGSLGISAAGAVAGTMNFLHRKTDAEMMSDIAAGIDTDEAWGKVLDFLIKRSQKSDANSKTVKKKAASGDI